MWNRNLLWRLEKNRQFPSSWPKSDRPAGARKGIKNMANPVVNTALCMCSFGVAPCPLTVTSQSQALACNMPIATISDTTLPTFGMCSSLANPSVASATGGGSGRSDPHAPALYARGVWVPARPPSWWGGSPCSTIPAKLMCAFAGVISVNMTPAMTVNTP